MSDLARHGAYSTQRIGEKQVHELIGIARGMLADDALNDSEIAFLHRWLAANDGVRANPLISRLVSRLDAAMHDGRIDEAERSELAETLMALTANDFELGEVLKSSTLPLCNPPPALAMQGARMSFTGTFTFGTRKECEAAATASGATCGSLTQRTQYLVIGEYATESWKHSSFGNKIMQAVDWRDAGVPIAIVSEGHWRTALP